MMVTMCFSCCKLMGTMLIQKGNFWIYLLHYLSIGYGINFSGCFSADFFFIIYIHIKFLSLLSFCYLLYNLFFPAGFLPFREWLRECMFWLTQIADALTSQFWRLFSPFFSPFRWIELDFYAAVITRNAHQLLSCFRLAMKQPITM